MTKIITHIEALEKARNFCAYQERCQQEVIAKLKSYLLDEDEMNYVLLLLIQGNYLNEERFARTYASGKFRIKRWGKTKIAYHLKSKGISAKCIELGISEIDDQEYFDALSDLVALKWSQSKEKKDYIKKGKIVAYLRGRGFDYTLVNELLSEYTS